MTLPPSEDRLVMASWLRRWASVLRDKEAVPSGGLNAAAAHLEHVAQFLEAEDAALKRFGLKPEA